MRLRLARLFWVTLLFMSVLLVLWGMLQQETSVTERHLPHGVEIIHQKLSTPLRTHKPLRVPIPRTRQMSYTLVPGAGPRIKIPPYHPNKGGPSLHLKPPPSNRIWPLTNETEHRILPQMNHIPDNQELEEEEKLILIYYGFPEGIPKGKHKFEMDKCPVQNCRLTDDNNEITRAHSVVFQSGLYSVPQRPLGQIWIYYALESPENIVDLSRWPDVFNWTASYRVDSTINTPYERFVHFANYTGQLPPAKRNYSSGKTHQVAWFVSNCASPNGRSDYAKELQNYIDVDIYGACGDLECYRSRENHCWDMLNKKYKFYLAFENSNCRDYITEKFYWNGLNNDILPIVMGARPEDYALVAPPNSYIHVDDFESPRHLAEYLHVLDQNDTLYNEYFRWKGTGQFIDTKYWCRLCSLTHEATNQHSDHRFSVWYNNIQTWWNGRGVCVRPRKPQLWATWRNSTARRDSTVGEQLRYGPPAPLINKVKYDFADSDDSQQE